MKKVCLITGAGGRLGNAFCRRYASRYAIVAVYRRNPPDVPSQERRLVDPLRPGADVPENAHPVFAIRADLLAAGEMERVVESALARYGRIDLVVNAAVHSVWSPIVDGNALLDSAAQQFATNVVAPLKLAQLVARRFWAGRAGENASVNRSVINVSSTAGLYVYPGTGQSVYSASKAALNYLTLHMADEFGAFGVRVNGLAPNSFPQVVRTADAARMLVHLDHGTMSGRILVLDADGTRWI